MNRILCAALFLSLSPDAAFAVVPVWEQTGVALRGQLSEAVPSEAAAAWQRFRRTRGSAWRSLWDHRGVPRRLWGRGIDAPGTVASPERAEAFALAFVEQHLDLLAPGARLDELRVVTNNLDAGMRTIGLHQYRDGLRVVGGQLSLRFKNDRLFVVGSEAVPHVPVPRVKRRTLLDAAYAHEAAESLRPLAASATPSTIEGPFILPSSELDRHAFRTVVAVQVDTHEPRGRFRVYVDVETGEPVEREQLLRFAEGHLHYNVPDRWPGAGRVDAPATAADVAINGDAATVTADGTVAWNGDAAATVVTSVTGSRVEVINRSGNEAQASFTLAPGATVVWDERDDERVDAQLSAYIAATRAMSHARGIAPDVGFFRNRTLSTRVNLTDEACNAYSDGETINFYAAGGGCENTARLADVVYHEFGHVFHAQVILPGAGAFDTALSEGAADYFAASITGDPGTARGFFGTSDPLRHIDPPDREAAWPRDVDFDPHVTGLIFAGAMWDLRKALVAEGTPASHADWLMYQALRRSSDIPSSFVEVLAADDDDGDLANGTPNRCTIETAFGAHGLVSLTRRAGVGAPQLDGLVARVPVSSDGTCGDVTPRNARLFWRGRDSGGATELVLNRDDLGFGGELPVAGGRGVVEYRIEVELDNGDTVEFPRNPASPWYETWVGDTETIYCTDFESDPEADGWMHDLLEGHDTEGADDWQWGSPAGIPGSGDPEGALSGDNAIGNDLGGGEYNGQYQAEKVNAMLAPAIPVAAYDEVRLQYWRWLTVEDAKYDRAAILSNGVEVWSNQDDDGNLHHVDHQWRFHDVDLTDTVENGKVQVEFRLESDEGLEFGGWTVDDFCIVGASTVVECVDCGIDPFRRKHEDEGGCTGANPGALGALLAGWLLARRRRR